MNHLGHALPWNALNASFIRDERDPNREERFKGLLLKEQDDGGLAAFKHVMHFSRCLHTKVEEFRATEKWRDVQEVERQRFDHTTWGNFKNMWCMPEAMSTLCGYIDLNMLLLDEQKWRPLLSERYTAAIREMSGSSDRGHPDWLAEPFRRDVVDATLKVRPLDEEGTEAIQTHMKKMFQLMYRSPPLSAEDICRHIIGGYGLQSQIFAMNKQHGGDWDEWI
jgi:hypothetical protein